MATRGPLYEHAKKHPHRVVFLLPGIKYCWLCYKKDDGTKELITAYSRKRDCFRALRSCGYLQHGSSWSLPSTMKENEPTRPEELATVQVFEGESEPVTMPWPFADPYSSR